MLDTFRFYALLAEPSQTVFRVHQMWGRFYDMIIQHKQELIRHCGQFPFGATPGFNDLTRLRNEALENSGSWSFSGLGQ